MRVATTQPPLLGVLTASQCLRGLSKLQSLSNLLPRHGNPFFRHRHQCSKTLALQGQIWLHPTRSRTAQQTTTMPAPTKTRRCAYWPSYSIFTNAEFQVVQQHVEYWDTDHDGIIWPQDTYIGCRKWGWSPPLAALTTFIINFSLSYPTLPGFLPDPFFRIYVNKVYKDKHGSDSMTYDNEGRFRPQNFEDIFAKYDEGNKGGLDIWDFLRFWKGQRMVFDFFGWSASFLECRCSTRL